MKQRVRNKVSILYSMLIRKFLFLIIELKIPFVHFKNFGDTKYELVIINGLNYILNIWENRFPM